MHGATPLNFDLLEMSNEVLKLQFHNIESDYARLFIDHKPFPRNGNGNVTSLPRKWILGKVLAIAFNPVYAHKNV